MTYKKAFVDSDIILDLLLQRKPYVDYSENLLSGVIPSIKLCTSTLILANVHYLTAKNSNKRLAKLLVKEMTTLMDVFSFNNGHILEAVKNDHVDFEDSIQYYIAKHNDCDVIITRNIRHYKTFDIPALTAEQFLKQTLPNDI